MDDSNEKSFSTRSGVESDTDAFFVEEEPEREETATNRVEGSALARQAQTSPALEAFQRFLERERAWARRRMMRQAIGFSAVFATLLALALGVVSSVLQSARRDIDRMEEQLAALRKESGGDSALRARAVAMDARLAELHAAPAALSVPDDPAGSAVASPPRPAAGERERMTTLRLRIQPRGEKYTVDWRVALPENEAAFATRE
jgi:hypothetical protein